MTDISEKLDNLHLSNKIVDSKKDKQQPFPNLDQRKGGIIHIRNNVHKNGTNINTAAARKRSNSQSQVVNLPIKPKTSRDFSNTYNSNLTNAYPKKRNHMQYYVTLLPLNDTFIRKHLPVSIFPETTKLGRPTGAKHKPDVTNGYFDSRVLSRNHAQVYIDSNNGKLMLQDLGSSNGTYLNDTRLTNEPTEIKIGDIVCLGFNVQAESTHKQISLKIDNIDIIANTNFDTSSMKNQYDTPQFKHLSFVEDIYRKINAEEKQPQNQSSSFDSAMFGDVNPILEDELLGLFSNNSGIYNNSQIKNTTAFENIINSLLANLSKVKQQSSALNSLQNFLVGYQKDLNEINNKFIEEEFSNRSKSISDELSKEKTKNKQLEDQLKKFTKAKEVEIEKLNNKIQSVENDKSNMFESIRALQIQVDDNELKYKNTMEQLEQLQSHKTKDVATSTADDFSNDEETHDLVSDAINAFIMDLSRTPSVRDNMKSLENTSISKSSTLKDAIELTPPSSDNEEEEDEENLSGLDEKSSQDESSTRKSSKELYTENLLSSSIIATNLILNEVEPFPKVEDSPSISSTSSISSLTDKNLKSSTLNNHKKFTFIKLSDQDKQRFSTFAIAMSFLLLGFYLQRLVN
ncbi:hypothetical protein KGF54_001170 [Candida jiufengensis]|uniref:uncharacterized protein n=1 Tax=Candida jiufengensis TaxID=497108 RepID=UPI0022246535|nr:uncharacterized protein KGF54_001170 [Candida jiufengensis]KAI5955668.1 hypothetical protein KGF54_001170 [Candida jiufengensis]